MKSFYFSGRVTTAMKNKAEFIKKETFIFIPFQRRLRIRYFSFFYFCYHVTDVHSSYIHQSCFISFLLVSSYT